MPHLLSPLRGKFRPENFFSRSDQLKNLKIPSSNSQVLIIRPNAQALGFLKNSYHERILLNKLDRVVFQSTIENANKICEAVWKKKKLLEEKDELFWLDYLIYVAFFLVFIGGLLVFQFMVESNSDYLYAGLVIFVLVGAIIMIILISNEIKKPKFIKLEETIYRKLKEYFEVENENVYKDYNMHWVVQERFFWLELHLKQPFRKLYIQ